jgi:hypothetical protein
MTIVMMMMMMVTMMMMMMMMMMTCVVILYGERAECQTWVMDGCDRWASFVTSGEAILAIRNVGIGGCVVFLIW